MTKQWMKHSWAWWAGQCVSHLLFLCLLPVVQEEQGSGQEKHAPQDDDEGTQHESVAQTEEPPQRRAGVALLEGVRDLQRRNRERTEKKKCHEIQRGFILLQAPWMSPHTNMSISNMSRISQLLYWLILPVNGLTNVGCAISQITQQWNSATVTIRSNQRRLYRWINTNRRDRRAAADGGF